MRTKLRTLRIRARSQIWGVFVWGDLAACGILVPMSSSKIARLIVGGSGAIAVIGAGILLAFKVAAGPAVVFVMGVLMIWFAAMGREGAALPIRWIRLGAAAMAKRREARAVEQVARAKEVADSDVDEEEELDEDDDGEPVGNLRAISAEDFECRTIIAGCMHSNDDGSSRLHRLKFLQPESPLVLVREDGNRHDKYAVRVYDAANKQVGYVGRTYSREVWKLLEQDAFLHASVIKTIFDDHPRAIIEIRRVDPESPAGRDVWRRVSAFAAR